MKGRIYGAKLSDINGDKAIVEIKVDREVLKHLPDFSKPMFFEVKPLKKKRSLAANNYMWLIADKIAKAIGGTKEDVYKQAIKDVGEFVSIPVRKEAAKRFCEVWAQNGLGNVADIVAEDMRFAYINAYYGSSTYTTDTMSRLIDWLVDNANTLGIETITPQEKAQMMTDWEENNA